MAKRKKPSQVYQFRDKDFCIDMYRAYLLNKTVHMFTYTGLPESIPEREIELLLQRTGNCTVAHTNGNLYVFDGNLGGKPDVYYRPTLSIVANPALNFNKELKIDKDCVVIHNDSMWLGIIKLADRYITQMMENDITQNIANINTRLTTLITCKDDGDKIAADKLIQDIIDGDLSSLGADELFGAVSTQPYGQTGANTVTQLIEYAQWLRSSLDTELGIPTTNSNLKREYVSDNEIEMYNDVQSVLCKDMLIQRQIGLEKVNEMFGTNISVEFSELWKPKKPEVNEPMVDTDPAEEGGESDESEQ